MPISHCVTGSYVGTNNVNAVDNSIINQSTTYNHTIMRASMTSSCWSLILGAKGRLSSAKDLLDQVLVELQFISEQGYDEDQCNDFAETHDRMSTAYYKLEEDLKKGFFQSFLNSSRAKELKKDAKAIHKTVMRASEAARREMARRRATQRSAQQSQRPTSNPIPLEPSPHPSSTHTWQPTVVVNVNIFVLS